MAVFHRIGNHFEYQTAVEGIAALSWLTGWVTTHAAEIRVNAENGHALLPLIPPHVEGCTVRLTCVYHMENTDDTEFLASFNEIVNAIQNGTVVVADCDTEFGQEEEEE